MEVTLSQILEAREQRAARQKQLLQAYGKPLVCFTMNIAGPVKHSGLISRGFQMGNQRLRLRLKGAGIPVIHFECTEAATGCQAFYTVDCDAHTLKALTAKLEDTDPAGRLFDMDVLDETGRKLDRQTLGLPPRTCLLCGQPAALCGRSRAHSVRALQEKTTALLQTALAEHLARLAVQSLLCEVYTTPKPGLVDLRNSGSHTDMDIFTFLSSTAALWPYFRRCAAIGLQTTGLRAGEVFAQLRRAGLQAEADMRRATGGVNTHKGAIFTLGLLCGSAGRLAWGTSDPEAIAAQCAAMTEGILQQELDGVTAENAATAGQRLYALHGITGARGQAQAGFPAVIRTGLPVLERGLRRGLSLNDAGCAALLAIIAQTQDTNLMARSDPETAREISSRIRALLQEDPYPGRAVLEQLDDAFIRSNLSPGGSADLLAASYFLLFLKAEAA